MKIIINQSHAKTRHLSRVHNVSLAINWLNVEKEKENVEVSPSCYNSEVSPLYTNSFHRISTSPPPDFPCMSNH